MLEVTDEQFSEMIANAMGHLPSTHRAAVKNVAIVYEDDPSPEQREQLKLECHQTLFGLYQGVPLSRRQGMTSYPPDKITIFKNPMLHQASDMADLQKQITHTVWHEVAHYFGLNHDQIHTLEQKRL
jgi:predicted Zn-dependent protease with MMP-like domain